MTGYSPYQLLHGTEPLLPLDLAKAIFLVEDFEPGMSTSDLLAAQMRQLSKLPEDVMCASNLLQKARFASKIQFEQRFQHRLSQDTYEPRELVLVRNTAIEMSHDHKHQLRYLGPYRIVRQSLGKAYTVAEFDGAVLCQKIGVFRLLPYIKHLHKFMRNKPQSEIDSDSENGSNSSGSSERNQCLEPPSSGKH